MIPTPFGDATGDLYEWKTKEGTFSVGYVDSFQPINDPEAIKQFFDRATERFKRLAVANGGDNAAIKKITLDTHPGIEQRANLSGDSIIRRVYLVSRRIYEMYVVVKDSQRESESTAVGVLNSFKLLTDSEITEEALKAGPDPLPQTPEAPRAGSDAADEGLRGPVKSVHTEFQYLSETPAIDAGTRSSLTTYNKNGNKLRTESYDFKNNLERIEVYGYLDGSRVSAYKFIQREYSLPVATTRLPSTRKKDPRYQHRFEFKYDEKKRLTEVTRFLSNGEMLSVLFTNTKEIKRRRWSTQKTAPWFGAIFTYSMTKAMKLRTLVLRVTARSMQRGLIPTSLTQTAIGSSERAPGT